VIKRNIRPGIREVTIGTFTRPMIDRFWMTGAAGVIQGMVITGTPGSGIFVTYIARTRIMTDGGNMAGCAIGCTTVVVTDFTPIIGIMTTLAQSWIVVGWCIMTTCAEC